MDNQNFSNYNNEVRLALATTVFLVVVLIASLYFSLGGERKDNSRPSGTALNTFPQVEIKARAAYVYDIRTGETLFAKNETTRLPLASLAKIMSALVAQELSPDYGTITINTEALATEGDSGLYKDERWSLRDLLDFSLLVSSNDGMRAIALALGALEKSDATSEEILNDFIVEMNNKASELGLKDTYFWNETGLDMTEARGSSEIIKGGAYSSVKDINELLKYILINHPGFFEVTKETRKVFQSLDSHIHVATNTNGIAGEIPGLLASKTGFTDIAGGNLAVIFDPGLGRPIIVSLLGSTEQGRFEDMRTLIDAVMEHIQND